MKSKFLTVDLKDTLRGIYMAVVGGIVTALLPVLQSGKFPTKEQMFSAVAVGIGVGAGYVIKNLLTNSNDKIGPEK